MDVFRYNFRMAPCTVRKLLTFVVSGVCVLCFNSHSLAAISTPSPDIHAPSLEDESASGSKDEAIKQTLDIAQPPPPRPTVPFEDREDFFYPFRKALTVRGGFIAATKEIDAKNTYSIIGIQYLFPTRKLLSIEVGADLLSDGKGVLHGARRWEFSRGRTRPYFKGGAGVQVIPKEQLVTFLKLSNYQLRGAAGFEYSINTTQSARFEFELTAGTHVMQAIASFGYVFGW